MEVLALGAFALGACLGGTMAWWLVRVQQSPALAFLKEQLVKKEEDLKSIQAELGNERSNRVELQTRLEEARVRLEEERSLLQDAEKRLTDTFQALSQQALGRFIELAKPSFEGLLEGARGDMRANKQAFEGMVLPIKELLKNYDEVLRQTEAKRQQEFGGLIAQVQALGQTSEGLKKETANLVQALRTPTVKGRWGEMTLKRLVELAGMTEHCDFCVQVSVEREDGTLRPDMVVSLPGGASIIVDAKVSLNAYLEALDAKGEESQTEALKRHAKQVAEHMRKLAKKAYASQFVQAHEFVVMFLPGEPLFSAAVQHESGLIEEAIQKRVLIATPTTLIALLSTVAYGWRQERLHENALLLQKLGAELYERLATCTKHLDDLGRALGKAIHAYNASVGSLESRVLVTARRFQEFGVPMKEEIKLLEPLEVTPRHLTGMPGEDALEAGHSAP